MRNLIKNWKLKRKLNRLKKQADEGRKMTGKQFFVVPVVTRGVHDYILMNKDLHDKYNRQAKKSGKKRISYPELLTMAVYKTKSGSYK